jgi:hypothetical protein
MTQYEPVFLAELLKESIQQGTTPSLTVVSSSMSPLLRSGDQVGLQIVELAQIRRGQIVTFSNPRDPADLVTHRVVGTIPAEEASKIITFGDRTLMFDMPISMENVVGRVIWRRRNGRVLDLESGKGAWLSDKLAQQAFALLQRLSGMPLDDDELELDTIDKSNELYRQSGSKMSTRLLRRANYLWASILAYYADSFLFNDGQG